MTKLLPFPLTKFHILWQGKKLRKYKQTDVQQPEYLARVITRRDVKLRLCSPVKWSTNMGKLSLKYVEIFYDCCLVVLEFNATLTFPKQQTL